MHFTRVKMMNLPYYLFRSIDKMASFVKKKMYDHQMPSLFHHSLIKMIVLYQLEPQGISWETFISHDVFTDPRAFIQQNFPSTSQPSTSTHPSSPHVPSPQRISPLTSSLKLRSEGADSSPSEEKIEGNSQEETETDNNGQEGSCGEEDDENEENSEEEWSSHEESSDGNDEISEGSHKDESSGKDEEENRDESSGQDEEENRDESSGKNDEDFEIATR